MKLIYIQTLKIRENSEIPFRITVGDVKDLNNISHFLIRPEITISKRAYELQQLNRMTILSAPPFCDIADELIDLFQDALLIFTDRKQFSLLKSQFKIIGYNFNVNPKILWNVGKSDSENNFETTLLRAHKINVNSEEFAHASITFMRSILNEKQDLDLKIKREHVSNRQFDLSVYKANPGVYFFLDKHRDVIYVGKAKNIRKRLQSHFSITTKSTSLDYSKVCSITVDYTGNDVIAQLIESDNIKFLKPVYNTQQVLDASPFIINKGETAKGIHRLKITRKDINDNMPERYFNRLSVKKSLEEFCSTYRLCRKHCALETAKGPCSNVTIRHQNCVCAGTEPIESYNKRFDIAFHGFQRKKTRKVYKLTGRNSSEDAFIYTINGIFQGYGFIDKNDVIRTENDILGNLISMKSNYDTSRIIAGLSSKISEDHILILE